MITEETKELILLMQQLPLSLVVALLFVGIAIISQIGVPIVVFAIILATLLPYPQYFLITCLAVTTHLQIAYLIYPLLYKIPFINKLYNKFIARKVGTLIPDNHWENLMLTRVLGVMPFIMQNMYLSLIHTPKKYYILLSLPIILCWLSLIFMVTRSLVNFNMQYLTLSFTAVFIFLVAMRIVKYKVRKNLIKANE